MHSLDSSTKLVVNQRTKSNKIFISFCFVFQEINPNTTTIIAYNIQEIIAPIKRTSMVWSGCEAILEGNWPASVALSSVPSMVLALAPVLALFCSDSADFALIMSPIHPICWVFDELEALTSIMA